MTKTCVTVFCKSISNRLLLTMDIYQLHAAKLSRVRPSWICGLYGWKSSSSHLPVAIKRLHSLNEKEKASFARLCFSRYSSSHGFPKTAKVSQGRGYQLSEGILKGSNQILLFPWNHLMVADVGPNPFSW